MRGKKSLTPKLRWRVSEEGKDMEEEKIKTVGMEVKGRHSYRQTARKDGRW